MPVEEQEEVRAALVERLRRDLIGPAAPDEKLLQDKDTREGDSPLTRYLTGMLYPSGAAITEEDDEFSAGDGDDDNEVGPEAPMPVHASPKPGSLGLSFAVDPGAGGLAVEVDYGLYHAAEVQREPGAGDDGSGGKTRKPLICWTRAPVHESVRLDTSCTSGRQTLPGGARLEWACSNRGGVVGVTVFLRNANVAVDGPDDPALCLFQPRIVVQGDGCVFLNRPLVGGDGDDPDMRAYRLLYRDKPEFAVGHGCAAGWEVEGCPVDRARMVCTDLLPMACVPVTEARGGLGLAALDMEALAGIPDGAAVRDALRPLADDYEAWIVAKHGEVAGLDPSLRDVAREHLEECTGAVARIRAGLDLVAGDRDVFDAFRFANLAMVRQRRRSVEAANFQKLAGRTFDVPAPVWRPFQMAFILLNLTGIAMAASPDRELVDLLWFPTGGGKTEAYLGLTAFTLGLRRLRASRAGANVPRGDGGVTVLMRYTLRLLTIQQFQRAATLVCACETLRREDPVRLGGEPFSIGLWVGGSATPNAIDQEPDPEQGREPGALQVLQAFDPNDEPAVANPVQLRMCPWCGESLTYRDYRASKAFLHLQIRCPNADCDFHGSDGDLLSGIPAYVVDEDIYLRCPSLLVGTVDKFARLPWDDRTKALFGRVWKQCGRHGFLAEGADYSGKCGGTHLAKGGLPATGVPAPVPHFLPPELVIQDELHLINGPLGSLMGLYEAAVDLLCSSVGHRPKVIASTATIRRHREQILGLFDRESRQFPPPGLDASDSFFATEDKTRPGRLYLGLCAPGKSMKTAALRTLACLMHGAHVEIATREPDAVDPYWTTVYYFNSLRELGGALRLIDDDVAQRLVYLARQEGLGQARRPERRPELTSRVPARDISRLLREMEETVGGGRALDVLLSTNMISVGVDIQRFGLMVVTGQPKSSAEYIQATSRVGRRAPGLICTLFNWSRPRDLSHHERFKTFHSMMYRHVEAASVTPYSRRARDKALHGVFIALLRLLDPVLVGNGGAGRFDQRDRTLAEQIARHLLMRIGRTDPDEVEDARIQLESLVDRWSERLRRHPSLTYRTVHIKGQGPTPCLIRPAEEGTDDVGPLGTLMSLREVEKSSGLYYKDFRRAHAPAPPVPRGGR